MEYLIILALALLVVIAISLYATRKKKKKLFCYHCGSTNVKDLGFGIHCLKCGKVKDKI